MIDEKGKLFGLINIIDLTVLLLAVLLVGGVGYKMLNRGQSGIGIGTQPNNKEIKIKVTARLKLEEAAKALEVGDRLVAKNTWATGVIESVDYEPGDYTVATEEGELNLTTHPLWKDITVTIKGTTDVSGPIIQLGGQEIRVGAQYWIKTQKVELLGEIRSIEIQ